MYKIIIGMFFIAFNFPVKIEYVIIGLIPDFVGYLLIRRGLGELDDAGMETAEGLGVHGSVWLLYGQLHLLRPFYPLFFRMCQKLFLW